MLIYWEKNVGGVHEANDNDGCEIQKSQMKNDENKEQITDLVVNTVFIFNLQMRNNCSSVRFGIQQFKDDMLGILIESIIVFTRSLGVFT
jgi:hypothetical protein